MLIVRVYRVWSIILFSLICLLCDQSCPSQFCLVLIWIFICFFFVRLFLILLTSAPHLHPTLPPLCGLGETILWSAFWFSSKLDESMRGDVVLNSVAFKLPSVSFHLGILYIRYFPGFPGTSLIRHTVWIPEAEISPHLALSSPKFYFQIKWKSPYDKSLWTGPFTAR